MQTYTGWESRTDISIEKNRYYRYRILNNALGAQMHFRFIDFDPDDDKLTQNCKDETIESYPFYIIGADSSLFDKPLYHPPKK